MSLMRYKPIIEESEKIGWISGLVWTSYSAFDLSKSQQIWYGESEDEEKVFRTLHQEPNTYNRHIRKSLNFNEHGLVEFLKHIFTCIALIGGFLILLGMILCLKDHKYQILGQIGGWLFCALAIWSNIEGFITQIYKCALLRKLKELIRNCNDDLQMYGYRVKFPKSKAHFLFCIPIKICDFDDTTVLEIYFLKHETNFEVKNIKSIFINADETTNYETMV